jgi:hypothetical protein
MNYSNGKVIPFRLRTRRERLIRFLKGGWLEKCLEYCRLFFESK